MFGMGDLSERGGFGSMDNKTGGGYDGLEAGKGGFAGLEAKYGGMEGGKPGFGVGMDTKLAVSSALGSAGNPELGSVTPPHTPPKQQHSNHLNHSQQQNHVINSLNSSPFQYGNHYSLHNSTAAVQHQQHQQLQQQQHQYEEVHHKLNLSHQYDAMNMSEDCFSS